MFSFSRQKIGKSTIFVYIFTRNKIPRSTYVRNALLISHAFNVIDEFEFAVLYDINHSKNPDFPYWNYNFDLNKLTDDECKADFRFSNNDIFILKDVLQIPDI